MPPHEDLSLCQVPQKRLRGLVRHLFPASTGFPEPTSGAGCTGDDLWWFLPQKIAYYTTIPLAGARGAAQGEIEQLMQPAGVTPCHPRWRGNQ